MDDPETANRKFISFSPFEGAFSRTSHHEARSPTGITPPPTGITRSPTGISSSPTVYDDELRDIDEDDGGFTGKDWDEDVGLYYYNARWYDPAVGRFISEDSMADDPNLYGYCFNNPVNNIDPTGHWAVNVNWNQVLSNVTSKLINYALSRIPGMDTAMTLFAIGGTVSDQIKWANFVKLYSSMNEEDFQKYLQDQGINYNFNNITKQTVFVDSSGQKSVTKASVGAPAFQLTLTGDQKLAAFKLMQGNIKEFLENNPGLSLEQVKGVFDSAIISADQSWGFGKNEFRYEGRGSNYEGLYDAEAVVMNEGMVLGVFTRASTLPDQEYIGGTIRQGVYDYVIGVHPMNSDRPKSKPNPNATADTYAGKQYIASNLYHNGSRFLPTEYPNEVNNNRYIMVGGNPPCWIYYLYG